jgi:hypothetical protein
MTDAPLHWTPEEHATMCRLKGEGLRAVEIGRRMNRTKNSIVGRCHRTGLSCPRHTLPTTMETLQALDDRMDALNAESAAIPRLPVPAKANGENRVLRGFGSRVRRREKNGYGAVRALDGIS